MSINNRINPSFISDDSDEDGGNSSGRITLSVERLNAYLLACFTEMRRKEQQKFGPVPATDDPNSFLKEKASQAGLGCGEKPLTHPLLASSQQFSGDDPKLTAIPADNSKASERFLKLRLENQFRNTQRLGRRKSVTLSR